MKKYPIILICLMTMGVCAAEKIRGQIVYNDRTEDVTLIIPVVLFGRQPNTEALQKEVRYMDAKGKKHWLRPTQAKEFRFSLNGNEYRMVSRMYVEYLSKSPSMFLLQLIDGRVKLFEYRQTTTTPAGPNNRRVSTTETIAYLFQRGEEWILEPTAQDYKKQLTEYFEDCPKLIALIEKKELNRKDITEIATYYNTTCQGN